MIHETNVRRQGIDYTEDRKRRNRINTPPPSTRGNDTRSSNSKEENLNSITTTLLLDDRREIKIPMEFLNTESMPRLMDERSFPTSPPLEHLKQVEMVIEGTRKSK